MIIREDLKQMGIDVDGSGKINGINNTAYIIPQDPYSRQIISVVDAKTIIDVDKNYGLCNLNSWECNTITNSLINAISSTLSTLMKTSKKPVIVSCDMYEYITIVITNKVNEYAEKEGNINVKFDIGPAAYELAANGTSIRERKLGTEHEGRCSVSNVFSFNDETNPGQNEAYINIENYARVSLGRSYGISIPPEIPYIVWAVGITFIENLILELLYRVKESEEKMVSCNLNDVVEIYVEIKEDDVIEIYTTPGYLSKLNVKADDGTESDFGIEEE